MMPHPKYRIPSPPSAGNDERIHASRIGAPGAVRDPVCYVAVSPDSPYHLEINGVAYRFCTPRCLEKFRRWPERYVHGASALRTRRVRAARPGAHAHWGDMQH